MRLQIFVLMALLAMMTWGCSNGSAPAGQSGGAPKMTLQGGAAAGAAAGADGALTIPKDARWTISCTSISGANHAGRAKALREKLIRGTGMREWHLAQGENYTSLYFGFYRTIDDRDPQDPREGLRAQRDRKKIAELVDPVTGQKYFPFVTLINLEEADPTAPPEWNLRHARGYWSLQVAAFRNHPQRKDAAVQMVRDFRDNGYEAYYFHGPSVSSVCLGAWPREAIREQQASVASAPNPMDVLLVVPGSVPLPAGRMLTADGRNVVAMQPQVDVVDPQMREMMQKFPYHSDNYEMIQRVKTPVGVEELWLPSFLVIIPSAESERRAPAPPAPTPAAITDPWRAMRGSGTQGGKLRGLED